MSNKQLFRIQFVNQGRIYDVYAREVSQGRLFGFLEVAGMVFGKRSELVVDPSEEKLKTEFEGVTRSYIPMHSVIRIDEVAKEGQARISKAEGNVTSFPISYYPPNNQK